MCRDALLWADPSWGYTEPTCHGFSHHTCVAFLSNSGCHGAELKANRLDSGWPGSVCWEDEIKQGWSWKVNPWNSSRSSICLHVDVQVGWQNVWGECEQVKGYSLSQWFIKCMHIPCTKDLTTQGVGHLECFRKHPIPREPRTKGQGVQLVFRKK